MAEAFGVIISIDFTRIPFGAAEWKESEGDVSREMGKINKETCYSNEWKCGSNICWMFVKVGFTFRWCNWSACEKFTLLRVYFYGFERVRKWLLAFSHPGSLYKAADFNQTRRYDMHDFKRVCLRWISKPLMHSSKINKTVNNDVHLCWPSRRINLATLSMFKHG